MNIPIDTYLHICDYLDEDQVLDLYKNNAVSKDYIFKYRKVSLYSCIRNHVNVSLDNFDDDDVYIYNINDSVYNRNIYYLESLLESYSLRDEEIESILDFTFFDVHQDELGDYIIKKTNADILINYYYRLYMGEYDYILSIMDLIDFTSDNKYGMNLITHTVYFSDMHIIDKMLNMLPQNLTFDDGLIDSEFLKCLYYNDVDGEDIEKLMFLVDHPKIDFDVFFGNDYISSNEPKIWAHIVSSPRCDLGEAMTFAVSLKLYDLLDRRKEEVHNDLIKDIYMFYFNFYVLDLEMLNFLLYRFPLIESEYYETDNITKEVAECLLNHTNYDKEKNSMFTTNLMNILSN